MLALESHEDLVTLKLVSEGTNIEESLGRNDYMKDSQDNIYGDPENEGKTFDLGDKEMGNGC